MKKISVQAENQACYVTRKLQLQIKYYQTASHDLVCDLLKVSLSVMTHSSLNSIFRHCGTWSQCWPSFCPSWPETFAFSSTFTTTGETSRISVRQIRMPPKPGSCRKDTWPAWTRRWECGKRHRQAFIRYSSKLLSTEVELMLRNQAVMGSNSLRVLGFFFLFLSSQSLERSL